jgi:hypothetical protein
VSHPGAELTVQHFQICCSGCAPTIERRRGFTPYPQPGMNSRINALALGLLYLKADIDLIPQINEHLAELIQDTRELTKLVRARTLCRPARR